MSNKKGFTLIELIIVIAVLAILVTLAMLSYTNITKSAQDVAVRADIRTLETALQTAIAKEGNTTGYKTSTSELDDAADVFTDTSGNVFYGNSIASGITLYEINNTIMSTYVKKLSKDLASYCVDNSDNVYYKGALTDGAVGITPSGTITVKTVGGVTTTTTTATFNVNFATGTTTAKGILYADITTNSGADATSVIQAPVTTTGVTSSITNTSTGDVSYELTGLTTGNTYVARPYATTSSGTSFGAYIRFTTP